jgi:hypothetical protein
LPDCINLNAKRAYLSQLNWSQPSTNDRPDAMKVDSDNGNV